MSRKKIDLSGQKIGKWQVLCISNKNIKGHKTYLCQCECGAKCNIYHCHLRSGKSSKCLKCAGKENSGSNHYLYSGYGEITGNFFDQIRGQAKRSKRKYRQNLEFDLTIEFLWNLFLKQKGKCALSGQQLTMPIKKQKGTASLDRVDSKRGYMEDNVQWVHKDVNRMKNAFDQDYFIETCERIANNIK